MPNGILIIMKKLNPALSSARKLSQRIDDYFEHIKGEYSNEPEIKSVKRTTPVMMKDWTRDPEPPTITGLAFFIGFNSRQAFEEYEQTDKFANILKRARLRIETTYEKKLHQPSPYGAIFALKSLGWNEKTGNETAGDSLMGNMKIEIVQSGPELADSEKDVVL